jgi:hypothetical protein
MDLTIILTETEKMAFCHNFMADGTIMDSPAAKSIFHLKTKTYVLWRKTKNWLLPPCTTG